VWVVSWWWDSGCYTGRTLLIASKGVKLGRFDSETSDRQLISFHI
jgi:hypothetical protein